MPGPSKKSIKTIFCNSCVIYCRLFFVDLQTRDRLTSTTLKILVSGNLSASSARLDNAVSPNLLLFLYHKRVVLPFSVALCGKYITLEFMEQHLTYCGNFQFIQYIQIYSTFCFNPLSGGIFHPFSLRRGVGCIDPPFL